MKPSPLALKLSPLISSDIPFDFVRPPKRMVWTASSMKLFRNCKRKWFWKYILRLRPRYKAAPLIIGSLFHDAVEAWYSRPRSSMAKIAERLVRAAVEESERTAEFYSREEWEKLNAGLATAWGMITGYADIHESDRREWKYDPRKDVEQEFRVDMGDFDFAGKMDMRAGMRLYNWRKHRSVLVENKTAKKVDENYLDRLPVDTQIRGYCFGCVRGLGIKTNHVLYNVVRKSNLRRGKNEDPNDFNQRIREDYASRPGFYFHREPLMFGKGDLDAFEYELRQVHAEYTRLIRDCPEIFLPREWAPNDGTCNEFFRTCDFLKLCTDGLDRGTSINYVQIDSMHQELSKVSKE
jgi:hypothetical protein